MWKGYQAAARVLAFPLNCCIQRLHRHGQITQVALFLHDELTFADSRQIVFTQLAKLRLTAVVCDQQVPSAHSKTLPRPDCLLH